MTNQMKVIDQYFPLVQDSYDFFSLPRKSQMQANVVLRSISVFSHIKIISFLLVNF